MAESRPNDSPWTQRLEQTRSALTLLQSKEHDAAMVLGAPLILSLGDIPVILNDYSAFVVCPTRVEEGEESIEYKKKRKYLILTCRQALRFAIALLSLVRAFENDEDEDENEVPLRRESLYQLQLALVSNKSVQEESSSPYTRSATALQPTPLQNSIDELSNSFKRNRSVPMHMSLAQVITTTSTASDVKCQSLAAQLLSNLVTNNPETATQILTDIRPSNSYSQANQMLSSLKVEVVYSNKETEFDTTSDISWGDMVIQAAKVGSRTALGAINATLYNATRALLDSTIQSPSSSLLDSFASDKVLVCNLIRYILPATVISKFEEIGGSNDVADDATEWISLLLVQWSSMGYLAILYSTLGPSNFNSTNPIGTNNDETRKHQGVTPEQLVLLHCLAGAVEESTKPQFKSGPEEEDTLSRNGCVYPLGFFKGELSETCVFLVQEWARIQELKVNTTREEEWYLGEKSCLESASILILEMLATTLGSHDEGGCTQSGEAITSVNAKSQCDTIQELRVSLGQSESLVSHVILELSLIVDRLQQEFGNKSSRELKLEPNDQRWLTCLVRLLGNLCYRCHINQDLVRTCLVPPTDPETGKDGRTEEGNKSVRNGVHVLLSCTSFGFGCFTLREWAIMTTRYVLDNNEENQAVVEMLEAQAPIDTPELRKVGIKVKLDKSGKVHVTQRD
jgi:hypothetical protein